jgi:ketosteroid isomerase-like protein
MKKFLHVLSISALLIIISCSNKQLDTVQLKQKIINTDKAMSDLAVKEGFLKAILHYADDDIVKFNDGNYPVIGKKAYEELYGDKAGPKTLTWAPLKAEVAKSGELGYTWGNWKYELKDTTYYGNYFTVWKLQQDGSWKVALDGGNTTPPPLE